MKAISLITLLSIGLVAGGSSCTKDRLLLKEDYQRVGKISMLSSGEQVPGGTTGDTGWVSFSSGGNTVTYTTVRAADGNVWLQQNLGSSRVANTLTDTLSYGGLFQWGRWTDGHEARNPERLFNGLPYTNPDKIPNAANNPFYYAPQPGWWGTGTATDRWLAPTSEANDVTTTNGCDPCREMGRNWRLPTDSEWVQLVQAESITNATTAFGSTLKLPAAGHRNAFTGQLLRVGTRSYFWSSNPSATAGRGMATLFFESSTLLTNSSYRGIGYSVRCIRDTSSNLPVPGTVIAHVPAALGYYVGSPSIAILPNGDLVASNDFFGGAGARPRGQAMSRIYRSTNAGVSWDSLADLDGQYSSTLFVHGGGLYIMGLSKGHGDIVIRKSLDGGETWTTPSGYSSGMLRKSRMYTLDSGYQAAPTPVTVYNGRIWRVMEDWGGPKTTFAERFRTFMLSAPVSADLLDSASWEMSNPMAYDSTYLGGYFEGWLEGNAVIGPGGQMLDVARVHTFSKSNERAALIKVSGDGLTATFNPSLDFVNMPGGSKKFTIRFDSTSNKYWTLSNYVPSEFTGITSVDRVRNTLALCSSSDLRTWQVVSVVIQHPDIYYHGYQYVDWQFDGNDIIAVSRTSHDDGMGGAESYHDSNYMTFHRIAGFRSL